MAKNMFLNRERAILSTQISSVRREEPHTELTASSIWNSPVWEKRLPFKILDETSKSFPKLMRPGEVCLLNLILRTKSKNLPYI